MSPGQSDTQDGGMIGAACLLDGLVRGAGSGVQQTAAEVIDRVVAQGRGSQVTAETNDVAASFLDRILLDRPYQFLARRDMRGGIGCRDADQPGCEGLGLEVVRARRLIEVMGQR
jgi:hypothetical protein